MDANCDVDCQAAEGALFCDGQYIPVEDLDVCLGEIEGQVEVNAHGQGQASIGFGCTVSHARPQQAGLLAGLLGLGLLASRRRARR
jgi:MYXO-CTERM domain-containing protein